MIIADFVEWELQKFRDECNFTDEELEFFEYRAKNKTIEQIAELMCISEGKANRKERRPNSSGTGQRLQSSRYH